MADLFSRRVAKVLPTQAELEKVASNKKLRVYIGIDPTATRLHLGHTIGIKKLMDFANAGHEAILLFGTGTVLVGDPSLRSEARKLIDQEQIDENITTWKKQVGPMVDFDKVELKQNGDWLTKMTLKDIVHVASNISATQLFKRESFTRRLDKGDTVWYHETMYPLLQGYDSVAMDVDVEIGGTDQEFNMLMGRELQKKMNDREKFVVEVPMILGTDGKQMSKTSGNCIWLDDAPNDMFGKLMSAMDEQIIEYMILLTDVDMSEVEDMKSQLESGVNPKEMKLRMAYEVTRIWHGDEEAAKAQEAWQNQFSKGELPEDIEEFSPSDRTNLVEVIVEANMVSSKSEARRMIQQSAVRVNGDQVQSEEADLQDGDIVQVGKRRFIKIK